ncbi:small multi-drug export protein [Patescibacteria group bacterium]|nr:small multi-drug export protein [Patescibacteria group bacterium]
MALESLKDTISPQALTFLTAMIPFTELRGAIPFGIGVLKLPAIDAFFWATLGNLVPNFILLAVLEPITNFFRKYSKFCNRIITKIFDKTRTRHSEKFDKYGALFLILFVAIPLPGSGGWSASMVAHLFGVKYWKAVLLISLGIAIAGVLITFSFEFIVHLLKSVI